MAFEIGGGITIGPGISVGTPMITATAGNTSPLSVQQNTAITSFNSFESVIDGTAPYTYFVSAGVLPTGIVIASGNGVVSGTATVAQSAANVTFSVKDVNNVVASTTTTRSFEITVIPISATAGATSTVLGYQNTAITSFNAFSSVNNGTVPYTYFVSSGTLPTGVTINSSTGLVSGTPTVTYSTANVTFSVRDVNNVVASTTSTVSFTVNAPISATAGATTTVSATQNSAISSFNPFSSVTGGYTPYTYFISSGTLPTGITINSSTGLVSGTPTVVQGASNVVFSVRDNQNTNAATTVTVSFTVLSGTFTVQYLVVAGGGAGGYFVGGGGGAGGLLTGSFNSVSTGTAFTITVGGGGSSASRTAPGGLANNGSSSNITSPAFSTVTTVGGGGGGPGSGPISPAWNGGGRLGGSGGGAGSYSTNSPLYPGPTNYAVGLATGSPGINIAGTQGYPGGGGDNPTSGGAAGGGGGAGQSGRTAPGGAGPSPANSAGPGGAGYTWPYTGLTYAGGGGGSGYPGHIAGNSPANPLGVGGAPGGGGQGGQCNPGVATAGTPGRGGGGGGTSYFTATQTNAAGGDGVVILAVPTPRYPGSAPGAAVTTPPAAPGMTVLTYTSSGSYTA